MNNKHLESERDQITNKNLLEAHKVSKSFFSTSSENNKLQVVDNFSLCVSERELVTFFGPNGCGKSTILNLFAGTIEPDEGKVLWNMGELRCKKIGYVFQNYADTLFPWRTVKSNIAFPLEIRGMYGDEICAKTTKKMEQFGLIEHAEKYIYQLSGGLKQLVSIARSTVYDPRLLLLDEPFSALDYSISRTLWTRFREYWRDSKVTTIFVSHNVDEAIFIGDRVCVMSPQPTKIVAEISVPFGKKRSLELLGSQEFFNTRTKILKAFDQGRNI